MTINEEDEQVRIAAELTRVARRLAHSTRQVPNPSDSYALIGEISDTLASLDQVCRQLAEWHGRVTDAVGYEGENGDGATATVTVAVALDQAAAALTDAGAAVEEAHAANGVVRWIEAGPHRR